MQRRSTPVTGMILMCYSDRHTREFHWLLLPQLHSVNCTEKRSVTAVTAKEAKDHGADKGGFLGSSLKDKDRVVMIEDVTTSGKSMEETVPKVRGAANVEIVGLMVSLNRMEVGQGGVKSALDEIHEKYGFEGKAIVTMEEVVEHLYNRECQGRIVIDDTIRKAIDAYYEQYGCK